MYIEGNNHYYLLLERKTGVEGTDLLWDCLITGSLLESWSGCVLSWRQSNEWFLKLIRPGFGCWLC